MDSQNSGLYNEVKNNLERFLVLVQSHNPQQEIVQARADLRILLENVKQLLEDHLKNKTRLNITEYENLKKIFVMLNYVVNPDEVEKLFVENIINTINGFLQQEPEQSQNAGDPVRTWLTHLKTILTDYVQLLDQSIENHAVAKSSRFKTNIDRTTKEIHDKLKELPVSNDQRVIEIKSLLGKLLTEPIKQLKGFIDDMERITQSDSGPFIARESVQRQWLADGMSQWSETQHSTPRTDRTLSNVPIADTGSVTGDSLRPRNESFHGIPNPGFQHEFTAPTSRNYSALLYTLYILVGVLAVITTTLFFTVERIRQWVRKRLGRENAIILLSVPWVLFMVLFIAYVVSKLRATPLETQASML